MRIGLITRHDLTSPTRIGGGLAYRRLLYECLARHHDVELVRVPERRRSNLAAKAAERLAFAARLQRIEGEKDLWIRDFRELAFLGPLRTRGRQIVVLHHFDARVQPNRLYNELADRLALRRLREADVTVTVSRYWQARVSRAARAGGGTVRIIYNAIDPGRFERLHEGLAGQAGPAPGRRADGPTEGAADGTTGAAFRRRLGLPEGPLVYIGNRVRGKGTRFALSVLAGEELVPVTSGPAQIDLPCPHLEAAYEDYLRLLAHSLAAVLQSRFDEGWCITAHEAMMCGTPVIGSGRGGMRELLEEGGQFVTQEPGEIRAILRRLRQDPAERAAVGERGRAFAAGFTRERFERAWLDLVAEQAESRS